MKEERKFETLKKRGRLSGQEASNCQMLVSHSVSSHGEVFIYHQWNGQNKDNDKLGHREFVRFQMSLTIKTCSPQPADIKVVYRLEMLTMASDGWQVGSAWFWFYLWGHICVCTLTGYTMCVEVDCYMSQFSLSIPWVLGIKLKPSVLVVSIVTHWAILPAHE